MYDAGTCMAHQGTVSQEFDCFDESVIDLSKYVSFFEKTRGYAFARHCNTGAHDLNFLPLICLKMLFALYPYYAAKLRGHTGFGLSVHPFMTLFDAC